METRLNIIHLVLGKANPNRMNGVNKVVYHLANSQARQGHTVEVWGITTDPGAPAAFDRDFSLKLFQSCQLGLSSQLVKAIRELNTHTTFHIHGGFIFDFFLVSRHLKKSHISFVFTPHGAYNRVAMERSKYTKKLYFPLFEKSLLKRAKYIHLIGKSEGAVVGDMFDKDKFKLIPNGQTSSGMATYTANGSVPVFGFMGRIDIHTKGLDLLLKGFANYKMNCQGKGILIIMGGGVELQKLKLDAIELGIQDAVQFPGAVFGKEKLQMLSRLTAFYHTSRNEGMPGAVLEAASLGIPCVVSEETNVKSYVEDFQAGIGLAKNTVKHITESLSYLEKLHDHQNLKPLSANAQRMIKQAFNWDVISAEMCELYAS